MSPAKRRLPFDSPSVLIIDDDADARLMYGEYMRMKRWTVFTATDGRTGLDKAADLTPNAIVLDLAMPRVDGWTVLRGVRDSSWTARIPIVVVSAVSDVRDKAYRSGCDAFLAKPCEPEIVWQQVRALLRLQASADFQQV